MRTTNDGSSYAGSGLGGAMSGLSGAVKAVAKTAAPAPKRRSSNSGSSSRNSGYSSRPRSNGNGTGGSGFRPPTTPQIATPRPPVGNTPSGTIARSVPAAPAPMTVDQYLAGDTAFNSQKTAYQKALSDYAAQMQAEQGKYNGEYGAQTAQLGLDRQQGVKSLTDDYASRGLLQSGVYADAQGELNKKFDTSAADLERAKQAYMSDLTTGQTNFQTTQQTLLEKARQDALNRRLDSMRG